MRFVRAGNYAKERTTIVSFFLSLDIRRLESNDRSKPHGTKRKKKSSRFVSHSILILAPQIFIETRGEYRSAESDGMWDSECLIGFYEYRNVRIHRAINFCRIVGGLVTSFESTLRDRCATKIPWGTFSGIDYR